MSYHLPKATKFLDILTVGFENSVVIFMITRLTMDMIAREMLFLDLLPIVIVLVNLCIIKPKHEG
jgi:hypothetical protein